MYIKAYEAIQISPVLWNRLNKLTLGGEGCMSSDIIPYMKETGNGKILVAFNNRKRAIGWSCYTPGRKSSCAAANFATFVERAYRHKGIGKALVDMAIGEYKDKILAQVAKSNYGFFNKVLPKKQKTVFRDSDFINRTRQMANIADSNLGL